MPMRPISETINEQLDRLNRKRKANEPEKTYYWLAQKMKITDGHLWNLRKDRMRLINFTSGGMLEKLCLALECSPGDLLQVVNGKRGGS